MKASFFDVKEYFDTLIDECLPYIPYRVNNFFIARKPDTYRVHFEGRDKAFVGFECSLYHAITGEYIDGVTKYTTLDLVTMPEDPESWHKMLRDGLTSTLTDLGMDILQVCLYHENYEDEEEYEED